VPFQGEALGWLFIFGFMGLWLLFVSRFFGGLLIGLPLVLVSIGLFYAGAGRFFQACMNGAREGRWEPQSVEHADTRFMVAWVLPGFAVLIPLLFLVYMPVVLLASGGSLPPAGTVEFSLVLRMVGILALVPYPAMMAVYRSRTNAFALFDLPSVIKVIVQSGSRYLLPAIVLSFAAEVPYTILVLVRSLGLVPATMSSILGCVLCGYAFGATGAAMGWIAYHEEGVRDALDGV